MVFDLVEHTTVFNSLRDQGVKENYIKLIEKLHDNSIAITDYIKTLIKQIWEKE